MQQGNITWQEGWRYGLMGLPLAFIALPLYVVLPHHYAHTLHVPLVTLGLLLLGTRLLDACIDPLLGRWLDRSLTSSAPHFLRHMQMAVIAVFAGFVLLFFPWVQQAHQLLWWAGALLMLTYAAYSVLSIGHQSWGAALGGNEHQRSRIVAWREGLGLVGVVLAAVTPAALGLSAMVSVFGVFLVVGLWAWHYAPRPTTHHRPQVPAPAHSLGLAWSRPDFRALVAVFMVNGIASAIPATLLLFFVQDRLQAAPGQEALFLACYFVAAALSIPLWVRAVRQLGLARTWLIGMLLALASFIWAAQLDAGDSAGFIAVCIGSGLALGADLSLPSALLAGVIAKYQDQGRAEGAYFGWWNFATKLNLALASGIALPALSWLGYSPGARDPHALQVLTWAYCLIPCVLKVLAIGLLYTLILRKTPCKDVSS